MEKAGTATEEDMKNRSSSQPADAMWNHPIWGHPVFRAFLIVLYLGLNISLNMLNKW